jgi:hypothetical protein
MSVPPDIIEALDSLVRQNLQGIRDTYFAWLLWSSGIVATGIILEGPELFNEVRDLLLGIRRALPSWITVVSLIGWAVVLLGVIGEGISESLVSMADGSLQTFNAILFSAQAATVKHVGAIAARARIDSEESENLARSSVVQSDRARVSASAALKSADNALSTMGELAKRASIIEKQLVWRDLTLDQQKKMAGELLKFSGQQFDIVTYPNEPECMNLVNEVYSVAINARWVLDPKRGSGSFLMFGPIREGIIVSVSDKADARTKDAAEAFRGLLHDESLAVDDSVKLEGPEEFPPNPTLVKFTVGRNPRAMHSIIPPSNK